MKVHVIVVATATSCTQSMLLVILKNSCSKLCMMTTQTTERIVKTGLRYQVMLNQLRKESQDPVRPQKLSVIEELIAEIEIESDLDLAQVMVEKLPDAVDQESIVVEILGKDDTILEIATEIEEIVIEGIVNLVEEMKMEEVQRDLKRPAANRLEE